MALDGEVKMTLKQYLKVILRIERQSDGYLCGGTVIHPNFVLTSSECCRTFPMNVTFSDTSITIDEGNLSSLIKFILLKIRNTLYNPTE